MQFVRGNATLSEGAINTPTDIWLQHFTYLLTYLLTPWSRVLLEKLTGSAASQEIPRIFGTWRFITVLTSARHLSLSSANSIQSPQPPPTSWRSILILFSHLRLGLPIGLFSSGFPTRTLCTKIQNIVWVTWGIQSIVWVTWGIQIIVWVTWAIKSIVWVTWGIQNQRLCENAGQTHVALCCVRCENIAQGKPTWFVVCEVWNHRSEVTQRSDIAILWLAVRLWCFYGMTTP